MARMTLEEALEATENAIFDIPEWVKIEEIDALSGEEEPHVWIEGIFPDGLQYEDSVWNGELGEMLATYAKAQNVILAVSLPLL